MRLFKIFIIFCFLMACAGKQKTGYKWPAQNQQYDTIGEAIKDSQNKGYKNVVIFITADWCKACTRLKKYWSNTESPIPFYNVNAETVTISEKYALVVIMGVALQLPMCIRLDEKGDGYIGIGYKLCTGALKEKIQKFK